MSRTAGSRLGPYVVGGLTSSGASGEWFDGSEVSLERPVSILVVPLPQDAESAATLRERARGRASLTDARLLPVYAQGEDGTLLWLATRKLDGRPLSEIDRLEPDRAARLGSQLAAQLAALDESGASPEAIPAESVMLEGVADGERAWLLPDPLAAVSADPSSATRSLVSLLDSRAGAPLLADPPSDPRALADELARLSTPATRSRRKLVLGAAVVLAALLVALVAVVAVTRDGSPEADPNGPAGTETAHIPVGAAIAALTVGSDTAWIVTPDGKLVRVDAKTNSVVGAAQPLFPKGSYVDLAPSGSSVWAGGPGKIVRIDPSGKVVETRKLGSSRAVSGLLVAGRSLLATVNDGPSPPVRLVRFDAGAKREVVLSEPFGIFAIPVLTSNGTVWAVGGDAAFTEIRAGSTRTIAVAGQAGFPSMESGRAWIPTRFDRTVTIVDPATMSLVRALHFEGQPQMVAAGAGSMWVLTKDPSMLYRVDPASLRLLGKPLRAPDGAGFVRFGAGSLWVDDPKSGALVRIEPATPAPGARPAEAPGDVLIGGPVPKATRLRATVGDVRFSIVAPDDGWVAEAGTKDALSLESIRNDGHGLAVSTPSRAFARSGRLVPVRSAADFLRSLKDNPGLAISSVTPVSLGGLHGFRVRVRADPKPPYPPLCPGVRCALLFPIPNGTYVLEQGEVDELTFVQHGRTLFFIDAALSVPRDPVLERRVHELESSIRFER